MEIKTKKSVILIISIVFLIILINPVVGKLQQLQSNRIIFILLVVILLYVALIYSTIQIVKRRNKTSWLVFNIISYFIPYIIPIFLIIYWSAGKNSIKDDELRKLQIELLKEKLRKGNVDIKLTGKMKKLK